MENLSLGWEDILDVELSKKTGQYRLYRNYKIRTPDGREAFLYSTSGNDPGSGHLNLFDTVPVAKGLTAFLVKGNPSGLNLLDLIIDGRPMNVRDFLNSYERISTVHAEKTNQNSINPLQAEDVIHHFLPAHILQEDKFLADSEKYFSEYLTEKEHQDKARLKQGAGLCLDWIHDSYMSLLQSNVCLDQSQLISTPQSPSGEPDGASDIPADIILLRNMEDLLKFIYQRFYEQAFSASRAFIAPIGSVPSGADVEYVYNIMPGSGIFNARSFKDKITAFMLRSDTNIKGLLTCLFNLHSLAEEAAMLCENYLLHKKRVRQISINVSFNKYPGNYIFHNTIATPSDFIRFANNDLYYFCNEISSFSRNLVDTYQGISHAEYPSLKAPSFGKDAAVQVPHLPIGILEYKINAALLPLTVADGVLLPCISNEYKTYLVQALVSVNKDGVIPTCKSVHTIRHNGPFFRIINQIRDVHKFSTLHLTGIISGSSGKSANTVRNNISQYKTPLQ